MNNLHLFDQHLFELINASPGTASLRVAMAIALASWLIYLLPIAMVVAWVRGNHAARRELLLALLAVTLALCLAQVMALIWPQPRPFALHLGTQHLDHSSDPGLPSDHVTVFWSLAFAMLRTRTYALWSFPLMALGLLVGWSRVYLGVHFPLDILAALPVAWLGTVAASALQPWLLPAFSRILYLYDRLTNLWHHRPRPDRQA